MLIFTLLSLFRVGVHLGLDKAKVGEFLGEKDDFNLLVLDAYAQVRSKVENSMKNQENVY